MGKMKNQTIDDRVNARAILDRPMRYVGPFSSEDARAILDQAYSAEIGQGFDAIMMRFLTGEIESTEAMTDLQLEVESIQEHIQSSAPVFYSEDES